MTQRGSKWPFALRSDAGTSGCGTCHPSSFRLPASELVPLRIDPVTRTTVFLLIALAPYGLPVIVSHEHGFIFMKTRKTAGTSVEIALSRICGPDDVITPDHPGRRAAAPRPRWPVAAELPDPAEPRPPRVQPHAGVDGAQDAGAAEVRELPVLRDRAEPVGRRGVALPLAVPRRRARQLRASTSRPRPSPPTRPRTSASTGSAARSPSTGCCATRSSPPSSPQVWDELKLPGTPDLPRAKAGSRPRSPSYRSYYDDATRDRVAELFAAPIEELGYTF